MQSRYPTAARGGRPSAFFRQIAGPAARDERLSLGDDRLIETHGGFVDKYFGDAIVAVFGAPLDDGPSSTRSASRAAWRRFAFSSRWARRRGGAACAVARASVWRAARPLSRARFHRRSRVTPARLNGVPRQWKCVGRESGRAAGHVIFHDEL